MELEAFLDRSRSNRARLIYCKEDDFNNYEAIAKPKGYVVLKDCENFKELRKLTPYDCVLVSRLDLMRGVDYRSDPHGIDELIANQFPNKRAYVQGLGRVGRYNEPCGRFIITGLNDTVDKEQKEALAGNILAKIEAMKPSKSRKEKTRKDNNKK